MNVDRELRIEPCCGATRAARRFVEQTTRDWRLGARAREIVLVCHELVANAIVHAGTAVLLRVRRSGNRVLIEVTDADPRLPCRNLVGDLLSTSGRGIMIVEQLSRAWGVRDRPPGKIVWAELDAGPVIASPSRQPHPV